MNVPYLARPFPAADLREEPWGLSPPPPSPLFWVGKKKQNKNKTKGRKGNRASKTTPPPLPSLPLLKVLLSPKVNYCVKGLKVYGVSFSLPKSETLNPCYVIVCMVVPWGDILLLFNTIKYHFSNSLVFPTDHMLVVQVQLFRSSRCQLAVHGLFLVITDTSDFFSRTTSNKLSRYHSS